MIGEHGVQWRKQIHETYYSTQLQIPNRARKGALTGMIAANNFEDEEEEEADGATGGAGGACVGDAMLLTEDLTALAGEPAVPDGFLFRAMYPKRPFA